MDDLPVPCVEQIIARLPVADAFICASVCKTWASAARYALMRWETLVLHDPSYEDDVWEKRPSDTITLKQETNLMMNRLMQMRALKRLYIYFDQPVESMRLLVIQNASTLESLYCPSDMSLLSESVVAFPALKRLYCRNISCDAVLSCPSLIDLRVTDQKSPDVIEKLNSNMMKFSYRSDTLPTFEPEFLTVTSSLMRLQNLKVLHLVMWLKKCKNLDPFVRLFRKLKRLQEVELSLSDKKLSLDEVVETLVQNNPMLNHVSIIGMKMTDESLMSLSRLPHLSFLEFYTEWEDFISTSGIMAFLRGSSRPQLTFCCLCSNRKLDMQQINDEISLIERETGRSFSRKHKDKTDCIHFGVTNSQQD